MSTANVRIPKDRRDILKIISNAENREMQDILSELIDEYILRHRETMEILSNPEWMDSIAAGKEEVRKGTKGKSVDDLED